MSHQRTPTKYDPADDRQFLGDGHSDHVTKRKLFGYPRSNQDYGLSARVVLPPDEEIGECNDALKARRPEAGEGASGGASLQDGYSFRCKMAGRTEDPDLEDY